MAERSTAPVVGFLAVLVLGALAAVGLPRLLGARANPEADLIATLKTTETSPLAVPVAPFGELKGERHQFERISTGLGPDGRTAVVAATLDFEGAFGATKVSSLGAERVPMTLSSGGWQFAQGPAPRLAAIVRALESRRRALEQGDPGQLAALLSRPERAQAELSRLAELLALRDRKYTSRAWYIRSEGDQVLVTEDYRLEGATPARPIDELGTRQLTLERRGQEFLFSSGLR